MSTVAMDGASVERIGWEERVTSPRRRSTGRRTSPLVLVVDDEQGIVDFLRLALEDCGYRVQTAANGRDALAAVEHQRPDCIVTDLMMPRLSGWDLCRILRDEDRTRAIPIVAMSAVLSDNARADAFLHKPFDLDDLLDTLEQFGVTVNGAAHSDYAFHSQTVR